MGRLVDEGTGFVGAHISANSFVRAYYSEVGTKGSYVQKAITLQFADPDSPLRVLVTTNGFGMGVDIPSISRIIHWGVTKSPVWYWQEIGRAGRDGSQSNVILPATPISLTQKTVSSEMRSVIKDIVNGSCVRKSILERLCISSIDPTTLSLAPSDCPGDRGDSPCTCEKCTCCSVCAASCKCKSKL